MAKLAHSVCTLCNTGRTHSLPLSQCICRHSLLHPCADKPGNLVCVCGGQPARPGLWRYRFTSLLSRGTSLEGGGCSAKPTRRPQNPCCGQRSEAIDRMAGSNTNRQNRSASQDDQTFTYLERLGADACLPAGHLTPPSITRTPRPSINE